MADSNVVSEDDVFTAAPTVSGPVPDADVFGTPPPANMSGVRQQADAVFAPKKVEAAEQPASFDDSLKQVFGEAPQQLPPEAPAVDPNREDVGMYRSSGLQTGPTSAASTAQLPKASRKSLMDSYAEGSVPSGRDWYNRAGAEALAAEDEAKNRELRKATFLKVLDSDPVRNYLGAPSDFITNQVTGLVAAVPGVATGIYNAIKHGDVFEFTEAFQETQEYLTYQPKSAGGKKLLGAMNWIMENLDSLGRFMAEPAPYGRSVVGGKGGAVKVDPKAVPFDPPPEVQALIYTSIAGGPLLMGLKQSLTAKPKAADPRVDALNKHGDAIEPNLPNPGEFSDVATILGGPDAKSTSAVTAKLRDIYTETGRRPAEVLDDASRDPVLLQELLTDGKMIPTAYESLRAPDVSVTAKRLSPAEAAQELDFTNPAAPVKEVPKTLSTDSAWRMRDRDRNVDPSSTDLGALQESIGKDGIKEPITVTVSTADGLAYVTDGNNRLAAAKNLNLPDVPINIVTTDVPFTPAEALKARPIEEFGWTKDNLPVKHKTPEQLEAEAWLRDQVGDEPVLAPLDEAQATSSAAAASTRRGQGGGGGQAPPAGGTGAPKDPIRATLDRIGEESRPGMTIDKLYTKVYDDLYPIARDVKAVRDEAGLPVDPAQDPYVLMRNSRGSGLAAESQIMNGPRNFGTNDATGTRGLKPILDDAQKAGGKNLDEFRAFLIARRDLEKLQQGVKTGGDATTAQAVVDQLGTKYAKLAGELTDFQNDMARRLVDAGVISEEAFASIKAMNADYVPFYRIVGDDVMGGSKGKGVQDPIRRMTGSDAQIVDPLQSIIKNVFAFEDIAKRNNARRAYIQMADQVPGLAEKVVKQTALDITPEVQKALKAAGVNPELADTFMAFRRETPNAKNNEINVFENGKRAVYRVEQDIAEAFNGLTQPQQGVVTKLAGAFARGLHTGVTATPDFIMKNLIRDPVDAWIKGGAQPLSPLTSGLKEVVKQDETYQRWAASGGGMASINALDRAYINRNIHKLDAATGLLTRSWNVITSPIELMKEIGDKGDQMTRLAAFRKAKAQGLSDTEAAFKARESTVDFARRGNDPSLALLRSLVPFFQVGLQAPERFVRALKDNPGPTSARIALLVAGSLALQEYNRKQDWYKELSPFERDMYWSFAVGDHVYKLPKPQEVGLVFASGAERIADSMHEGGVTGIADWAENVGEQLTPSPVPQAARPVLEGHMGMDTRFGRPLIPQYLKQQLPPFQYTEATSEIAKELGKMIGSIPPVKVLGIDPMRSPLASPMVIENYVRQWTGSLGQHVLKGIDQLAQRSGVMKEKYPAEMKLSDIPFVKSFVVRYPSSTSESIQSFEERYAMRTQYLNTIAAQQQKNPLQALELQVNNQEQIIRLRDISTSLATIRTAVQQINALPYTAMSKEEKGQMIDSMYYQMIQLSRAGNTIYDQLEKVFQDQASALEPK